MTNSFDSLGLLEAPTYDDELGVSEHVVALAKFVGRCKTPMTIAIQGGWGSGKTSVMRMMAKELRQNDTTHVITFNTWQYSQFDLGERLAMSLIERIIEELPIGKDAESNQQKAKMLKLVRNVGQFSARAALHLARAAVDTVAPSAVGKAIDAGIDEVQRGSESESANVRTEDPVSAISALRSVFQGLVQATGQRIVVLVDDLDRLEPKRALELMEAIKVFLDVEHCVFVLAIDFEIVKRGVASKYGQDLDLRKAREYFDKMIQVPFAVPVHSYDVTDLVSSGLKAAGLGGVGDVEPYKRVAINAVQRNPRALKRLLNSYALARLLPGPEGLSDEDLLMADLDNFVILALHSAYPDIGEYCSAEAADGDVQPVASALESDSVPENRLKLYGETWAKEWAAAQGFRDFLVSHFKGDGEMDMPRFGRALSRTGIFAASSYADDGKESQPASAVAPDIRWDLTTDPDEMSRRLLSHQIGQAQIQWAADFRQTVSDLSQNALEFRAQQGKQWTLRKLADSAGKRVGLLSFGVHRMNFTFESVSKVLSAEAIEQFISKIASGFELEIDGDLPKLERPDSTKVKLTWRVGTPLNSDKLARFVVDTYCSNPIWLESES